MGKPIHVTIRQRHAVAEIRGSVRNTIFRLMWDPHAEDKFGTDLDQRSGVGEFRYEDFMFCRSKSPGMVIRWNALTKGLGTSASSNMRCVRSFALVNDIWM